MHADVSLYNLGQNVAGFQNVLFCIQNARLALFLYFKVRSCTRGPGSEGSVQYRSCTARLHFFLQPSVFLQLLPDFTLIWDSYNFHRLSWSVTDTPGLKIQILALN